MKMTDAQRDVDNEAFWKNLAGMYKKTIQLIRKTAKEQGFDLDEVINSEENIREVEEKKARREDSKKHFLWVGGMQYVKMLEKWMKKHEKFDEKGKELLAHFEMGIKNEEESINESKTIIDCVEVVRWYSHFISVKFMRSLSGKEEDKWFEENGFQKDSLGSAKVALIAVERSMEAWSRLREYFDDSDDEILLMLAQLERIKRTAEKEFPDAWKFKRVGFDD